MRIQTFSSNLSFWVVLRRLHLLCGCGASQFSFSFLHLLHHKSNGGRCICGYRSSVCTIPWTLLVGLILGNRMILDRVFWVPQNILRLSHTNAIRRRITREKKWFCCGVYPVEKQVSMEKPLKHLFFRNLSCFT